MIGVAVGHDFTAAEFRDKLVNGPKVAIQILEFFDRHGITIRRGARGVAGPSVRRSHTKFQ